MLYVVSYVFVVLRFVGFVVVCLFGFGSWFCFVTCVCCFAFYCCRFLVSVVILCFGYSFIDLICLLCLLFAGFVVVDLVWLCLVCGCCCWLLTWFGCD